MSSEALSADCGFDVTSTPHAVSLTATEMHLFRSDCCLMRERHGATSFFMTLSEARKILRGSTRSALLAYVAELLVRELRRTRLQGAVRFSAKACGAEFWVQQRRSGDPINWHWDKDEELRDACELVVHPLVSTVTYLSTGGAPTVVLGARVLPTGTLCQPVGGVLPSTISYPRHGKLLRFNGRLLHGCPVELAEPMRHKEESMAVEADERVTLLVNVWLNHRPLGLSTLPSSTSGKLRCRIGAARVLRASAGLIQPPVAPPWRLICGDQAQRVHGHVIPTVALRVPVCEGSQQLRVRLPLPVQVYDDSRPPSGDGTATYQDAPLTVHEGGADDIDHEDGEDDNDE